MTELNIALVTSGLNFNGDTIKKQALGGSETALLCMGRELAALGHRVSVFCSCDQPGNYDGVDYYHHQNWPKVAAATRYDVLVVSRWMEFLMTPSYAGLRVLWCHDTIQDKARIWNQVWQCDQVMLLSDYHIANYTVGADEEETEKSKIAELLPWIWKTSNGIDMEQVKRNLRPKVPGKLIYTSRPERGLHYLLSGVMPRLLEDFPEIKLHFANYPLQGLQVPQHTQQVIELSMNLAKKYPKNVVPMGHLSKDELYQEISSAEMLVYPTSFPEISCITAMEAQACGTPIVSTNDFALKETVASGRTGFLINGKPEDGDEYFDKFARKVKMLLNDSPLCSQMSEEGPKWIMEQGFTWAQVAKSWEARFMSLMEDRYLGNSIPVIRELQRNHDLVMASRLALDLPRDETRKELVEELSACLEHAATPKPPTSGAQIKEMTKASTPRFNKMIQLMLVSKCDPKVVWDFACGDASFGLAMASSSSKVDSWCCDADEQVLKRINSYAAKVEEKRETEVDKRVNTIQATSLEEMEKLAAKPDLIFLGSYLDSVTEPWLEIEKATKIVGPGGWVAISTRFGPTTAVTPDADQHERVWDFSQEDYYEMFGREFKGALTVYSDGISPGGDQQGHWLALIPVPEEPFVCKPLSTDRRRRTTRPYQTIAACMIMRDSEDWVGLCLKRVLPLVDKVVVVLDDRTEDNTLQALSWLDPQGEKIEVRSTKFEDFSQMRNTSTHGVESDWIFWIDTDELLVDGAKLRRYARSTFFNGFSVRQNHLMLDVHGTFDIPVRLLRNKPEYRFVGCIHEHCMDVSGGDFDTPIRPSMLIQDVDLAHYGYLSEKQRRLKCSNRNMELLKKDIETYGKKGRKLTWILVIRDYLNIVKWQAEKKNLNRGISRGSEEHALLEAAIATYHEHFQDPKSRFHALAFPMYQEALQVLGKSGVPVGDRKAPPFSIALGLAASMGGDANDDVKAKVAWFLDEIECLEFMEKQNKMMLQKLGVVGQKQYAADLERPSEVEVDYSEELSGLLETGIHAIHQDTGKLR